MYLLSSFFIVGILGFLLLNLLTAATTTTITPSLNLNYVFAQDEEEEEEKEEDKDEEKEEEEEEEEEEEAEEEPQSESQSNEELTETVSALQENMSQLFIDPYAQTPSVVAEPEPTQQPIINNQTIDPMIVNNTSSIPAPSAAATTTINCNCTSPPPTIPTPQPSQPQEQQQPNLEHIVIDPNNIADTKSTGEITDLAYTGEYVVKNVVDNVIDETSFWSQEGDNSGFSISLVNPLYEYEVCSVEIDSKDPENVPFTLDLGIDNKVYTGVLDSETKKVELDKCVKNVNIISMTF